MQNMLKNVQDTDHNRFTHVKKNTHRPHNTQKYT